jgi:hypothetical protein
MREDTRNIHLAKIGMNLDTHPSNIREGEYIFALNALMEDITGEGLSSQNYPSNLLCSKFKDGFKVNGFGRDYLGDRVFFFLVNPNTKVSEIGYITISTDIELPEDEDGECKCVPKKNLPKPLEELTQIPYCRYKTLITDSCNKCLGLDMDYPINDVLVKEEKEGTTLYWTNDLNPQRYLQVDRIEQYKYLGYLGCDDTETETCLDCEKLKVFKDAKVPCIKGDSIFLGGNLREGTYEVFIAYCDAAGNELSDYMSGTQPIFIFNRQDINRDQTDNNQRTTQGIKLTVSELDPQYAYFKVAVIYTEGLNSDKTYFVNGVYSIDTNSVSLVTEQNKESITLQQILTVRPKFVKSKGFATSNGFLFQHGLTAANEMNLQPVVNLLGGMFEWITVMQRSDAYENPIIAEQFKSYQRDEVIPFSIRFSLGNGNFTSNFPLVGRPLISDVDLVLNPNNPTEIIVDNNDSISVSRYVPECSDGTRLYKWQYYSTATKLPPCETFVGDGEIPEFECKIFEETIQCEQSDVADVLIGGTITITQDTDDFTNPLDFLNARIADIISGAISAPAEITTALQNLTYTECTVEETTIDLGRCVGREILTRDPYEVLFETYTPDTGNELDGVVFNLATLTKTPESNYSITCSMYPDTPVADVNIPSIFQRNSNTAAEDCQQALTISFVNSAVSGTFIDYRTDAVSANLKSGIYSFGNSATATTTLTGEFPDELTLGAVWFKYNFTTDDSAVVQFEVLPKTGCEVTDDLDDFTEVRVTYYDSCPSTGVDVAIGEDIIELDSTNFITLTKADFPSGTAYIAIDAPIPTAASGGFFYTAAPCGCFGIFKRAAQIESIDIEYDGFTFKTTQDINMRYAGKVYDLDPCNPAPFERGRFGYHESTEKYPDNKVLFDSSGLKFASDKLDLLTADQKQFFIDNYTEATPNGANDYITTEDQDLTCKPIRHFRMPSNHTAPFMGGTSSCSSEAYFYPLGISIDNNVINVFLDAAVDNNLITQEQRDSIEGYEIFRGDRSVDKSIVANGYLYDMFRYNEGADAEEVYYANYPYNDLSEDQLHYSDDSRNNFIQPPYSGGTRNFKYTFHSPEIHFAKPDLPSEILVNGVSFGCSSGKFLRVLDHPEWALLSSTAYNIAATFATVQTLLDTASIISLGSDNGIGANNVALTVLIAAQAAAVGAYKFGQYRNFWLETFQALIPQHNYAKYYASTAVYNQFNPFRIEDNDDGSHQRGQLVRGLADSAYIKSGRWLRRENNESIRINHIDRESAVYLSLGSDGSVDGGDDNLALDYSSYRANNAPFSTYDNSRITASEVNTCTKENSPEVDRNVASLYVSLRNYNPSQYGRLKDIQWLPTSYCGKLDAGTGCQLIFGGDTYLGWLTLKRKLPLFLATAIGLGNDIPYKYSVQRNIGYPRYYADFLTKDNSGVGDALFPAPNSGLEDGDKNSTMDCGGFRGNGLQFYVDEVSKIYLYYYGIPQLPVESTINLANRYAGIEQAQDFYPNVGDYNTWTQESNVSIRQDNFYKYNRVYSTQPTKISVVEFPDDFETRDLDLTTKLQNAIIYSQRDTRQLESSDPWLVYKPNDFFEFPSHFGNLIDVKGIESNQILVRFEKTFQIYNAIDVLAERLNPLTANLGTGGIFSSRPINFSATDLGYGGTQHTAMVSTEFGHFWADAERGFVFRLAPNGKSLQEVSARKADGQDINMRMWFKEQLPFKLVRDVEGLTSLDVDNALNGLGLAFGWDSRYKLLYLTKKDYVVKPEYKGKVTYVDGKFFREGVRTTFKDRGVFEEASWTMAYSAELDSWVSAYSFKPDYYINYDNFFQSGLNSSTDDTENGLWSHHLTNRSYQVFYGKKYPWTIEFPVITKLSNRVLKSVNYWLDVKRFHNRYDFAENRELGFNKAWIFNNSTNSGTMKLVRQLPNNLQQELAYPKYNRDSTEILASQNDKQWFFNMFFDRVKSSTNNLPHWNKDVNNLDKTINISAIDYTARRKDRLRGDWFVVRLQQDEDTLHKYIFKHAITKDNLYL